MGPISLSGDELRTIAVLLGLVSLGIGGAFLHSWHDWRALRHLLFRPDDNQRLPSLPGRLAERLDEGRWDSRFRETLSRSRHEVRLTENSAAATALEAVERDAERLSPLVREIALRAMTEGEIQSSLVRLEELLVYVLVFPGRHDDRRTFRRSESLAQGWPAHAQAVHDAADRGKSLPMLSLLYFLGLDARSGTLLVAYEGKEGSLHPRELADAANESIPGSGAAGLSQEFLLV
jgi:hypothetical protein